ncbi:MAG: histidinol-phosphatase [Chitinophagaceae bacterium]|nr:histidinol-phosphatase [Chitinophagaceae bacterium]
MNEETHYQKNAKRLLFIDRDGTLIKEAPPDYQVDSFAKLAFYPHVFEFMNKIAGECNYELVMVSNQDGLGTSSFPETSFWPVQNFIIESLENENIHFNAVHFDRTFPEDHAPTRKPGIGMFTDYLNNQLYDLANSFVIGDRVTDMQLAKNLGCKGIWLNNNSSLGATEIKDTIEVIKSFIVLETKTWKDIYEFLKIIPTV